MHFNHTHKILTFTLCVFLLACGALGALLFGILHKHRSIAENAAAWSAAEGRRVQMDSLLELVDRTAKDRETLASFVLTDESVIDFLSTVERLARERGVSLQTKSLTVEALATSEVFESLVLDVEMTGRLEGVSEMVSLMETFPLQVSTNELALTQIGHALDGSPQWRGSMLVRVTKYK